MINLSTGAFYERGTRQIGILRARAETLQNQIGTGDRLERSSDDPVAAARLRTLARNERLTEVDSRNSDMAQADLALADQTLNSVAEIVIRVRELAVQASATTLKEDQRAAIGVEVAGLRNNLLLLGNSRNISGHALFGGQAAGAAYVDAPPGASYTGTGSVEPLEIGDGQKVVPAMTGPELFEFDVGGTPTDLFTVLGNLAAALQKGDPAGGDFARDSLALLDGGLEKITTAQTVVGARLTWIDLMAERRETMGERVASERADVGGADIAVTMSRLQETLTVLEASQASFVRLSNLSLFSILR
jgi:flagellar hook-associated protein 3 FlgL